MADAEIAFGHIRKMESLSLKNIVRINLPPSIPFFKQNCQILLIIVFFFTKYLDLGRNHNTNNTIVN